MQLVSEGSSQGRKSESAALQMSAAAPSLDEFFSCLEMKAT